MQGRDDRRSMAAPGLGSRNPYRNSTVPHSFLLDHAGPGPRVPSFVGAQRTGASTAAWTMRTKAVLPHELRDSADESTKDSKAVDSENGWATCLRVMADYDQNLLKGWKEDIDGLLLLAGLFSGVVTAFAIESYGMLQPDPTTTSTSLLAQISLQLMNVSSNSSMALGDLQSLISPPPFQPSTVAVRVNTLWFLSLSLGLLAALAGLLVKQWLRAYNAPARASVRARVRVRQARHAALMRWRVPVIVSLLPFILQAAVGLFLVGLVILLWSLDNIVAGAVSTLLAAAVVGFLAAAFLPALNQDCPYHSPLSDKIADAAASIRSLRLRDRLRWRQGPRPHDEEAVHELKQGKRTTPQADGVALDKAAIAWTQQLISGYELASPLLACVADLDREAIVTWVAQERGVSLPMILARVRGQTPWLPPETGSGDAGGDRVLGVVLDALADTTDETTTHAVSRMDITGLFSYLADEVQTPTLAFTRRCLNELLPILEDVEVLQDHSHLLSKLFLRLVEREDVDLSDADVERLALWALRMFRRLGSPSGWTELDEEVFEKAAGAALTALASILPETLAPHVRERARALLVALQTFFTHTSLPSPSVPWFGVLRQLLDSAEGAGDSETAALSAGALRDALEALVSLHRTRWADTWTGRASWGGEMQYEVLERMTTTVTPRQTMTPVDEADAVSLLDSASTWTTSRAE